MPFPTGCLCYRRTYCHFFPPHFHLKSKGATNQEHNNLYVYEYHTGPGINDAALTKDVNTASSVFLIGTKALSNFNTEFPWGVSPPAIPNIPVSTRPWNVAYWLGYGLTNFVKPGIRSRLTRAKEVMDSQ